MDSDTEFEDAGKRVRKLTEKTEEIYEKRLEKYQNSLINYRREIEETVILFKTTENIEKNDTIKLQRKLNNCFNTYELLMKEFSTYLNSVHTSDSLSELENQNTIHRTVVEKVVKTLNEMEMLIKNVDMYAPSVKTSSSHSHASSRRSNKSAILIASQKAKLKAARTRLEFEKKEAALKEEKIKIDSKMNLLDKEKEVAVETAVLEVLEEELSQKSFSDSEDRYDTNIQRKFEYVKSPHTKVPMINPEFHVPSVEGLNPMAKPFEPEIPKQLSTYLLKRDLLIERFYHFDDKPESFNIWKTSFQSILSDLHVSSVEEFDLLQKYLGPESKQIAIRIRQSNPMDIDMALKQIWERLHERFGSPELIEKSLKQRLENFPKITSKDNCELYKLYDLCSEIESTKSDPRYSQLLSYFDSSTGVRPIVEKLPLHIQNKWVTRASNYKRINSVIFPPFCEFCTFLKEMSIMLNDPGLCMSYTNITNKSDKKQSYSDTKTKLRVNVNKMSTVMFVADSCPFHGNTRSHNLNQCRTFKSKSVLERKRYLKDNNICFKCCNANSHNFNTCSSTGHCSECGSQQHPSGLHNFQPHQREAARNSNKERQPPKDYGREQLLNTSPDIQSQLPNDSVSSIVNGCTNICGTKGFTNKSCSKTILVKVHPKEHPDQARLVYCIIDDQSNRTLCRNELFQMWKMDSISVGVERYDLISCSGKSTRSGRTISGLSVSSLDNSFSITLPAVLECDRIPDIRSEIPTPEIVRFYEHFKDIAIPPLRPDADIILLIGRDVPEVHHVYDQRIANGQPRAPFAQKLCFGWVIIGEVCLNSHRPGVKAMKTYIHGNGRPSLLAPCESKMIVKTRNLNEVESDNIFVETKYDNDTGLSIEDIEFLEIMEREFHKDEDNHWTAPLPFRTPRVRLPNNKPEAYRRAKTFENSLKRDPTKLQHSVEFMGNLIEKGYCEPAPPLQDEEECWFLPLFGVYHPKKKDKIRIVFDSSSKFEGVSLNNVLMTGPDSTNNLTGILLRFRRESVAVTGDIEQMFYQFRVNVKHRNYLRFFWYEENDFSRPLVEYRMCVHVFGNSPSPAVATFGLRKTAHVATEEYNMDVVNFVNNNFYVDDGLTSVPTDLEAVNLIQNTQQVLQKEGNLRFHKIASNSVEVLKCFPKEDLANDLKHSKIDADSLPVQRSLGLCWNLKDDCFIFQMSQDKVNRQCYTKRRVLSVINSLFDPLGFLAPFTLRGKLLLRDITSKVNDWDEPLPDHLCKEWEKWIQSLPCLESLMIPRVYFSQVKFSSDSQLHVFCDASDKAIASVAYLRTVTNDENVHIAYVFGKTKVAPKHGHTIPRLELCASVLGVEIAEFVCRELAISADMITFYTDSKVVLGYITNKTRRFYVYVQNRVSRILKFSKPIQWMYIETDNNPADFGTRGIDSSDLQNCSWLTGQPLLNIDFEDNSQQYPLFNSENDPEIRPQIRSMKTYFRIGTSRYEKFSTWRKLVVAVSLLICFLKRFKNNNVTNNNDLSCKTEDIKSITQEVIIKQVQNEMFHKEVECLTNLKKLSKDSHILNLTPFLDEKGILRVGGRLKSSQLPINEKHPILIPGRSHIALLLVRHYHEEVHHQGRHITEGAVRTAGYWITGGRRLIANLIFKCVICRKLRGKFSKQMMSDLPSDRTSQAPPFTYVGIDVFGPWNVVTRRTRGGSATSKRWAVLFTCLSIRAIHIELIEEMSSSAFINALRRFVSIRGSAKIYRSDRGTNFIGATDDLHINAINVEDKTVRNFLYDSNSTWIFNPPHASHMGGAWERMIGITRRILDAILLENKHKHLTHDVLSTFMAEVCAIINARPITPVSTDPEDPFILTPSILLTQKTSSSAVDTFQHLDVKDMYKSQWKCVQVLAEIFWKRWKSQYLSQLQYRRIWQDKSNNLKKGDVVLLKDKSVVRNEWPVGLVTDVYKSDDGLVRKCAVKVMKDGRSSQYIRPIVELVKLLD